MPPRRRLYSAPRSPRIQHRPLPSGVEIRRPPLVPEVKLYLCADPIGLWERLAEGRDDPEACFPYWSVAWAGGQAVARYLLDNPDVVTGKHVLDFASGSGLCAIAALKAGAAGAVAAEVDPLARDALAVNARLNQVAVTVYNGDPLDAEPPRADLVLAGDVCYEREMTARVLPWLRLARNRGAHALVGDPGREYLPHREMTPIAAYDVPTERSVEGVEVKRTGVYALRSDPRSGTHAPK